LRSWNRFDGQIGAGKKCNPNASGGYCVEACPTDAIAHGHGFELATLHATNLVMGKEDMLLPVAALTAAK
jgi:ferredoxin